MQEQSPSMAGSQSSAPYSSLAILPHSKCIFANLCGPLAPKCLISSPMPPATFCSGTKKHLSDLAVSQSDPGLERATLSTRSKLSILCGWPCGRKYLLGSPAAQVQTQVPRSRFGADGDAYFRTDIIIEVDSLFVRFNNI